jgi:hypothetical protein
LSVPETDPQVAPLAAQKAASLSDGQAQTLGWPPPAQVSGAAHEPQLVTVRVLPQTSVPESWPHSAPAAAQKS